MGQLDVNTVEGVGCQWAAAVQLNPPLTSSFDDVQRTTLFGAMIQIIEYVEDGLKPPDTINNLNLKNLSNAEHSKTNSATVLLQHKS